MEHFSLLQPGQPIPAPPGLRAIVVRAAEGPDELAVEHDLLDVVALQPLLVHHYASDVVSPVHPTPELMDKHGWRFEHIEMRYAPIVVTREGRLAGLSADDPRWRLVGPGTPVERVEGLAATLEAKEVARRADERLIEEREDEAPEGD